jgi:hypothetical protein
VDERGPLVSPDRTIPLDPRCADDGSVLAEVAAEAGDGRPRLREARVSLEVAADGAVSFVGVADLPGQSAITLVFEV